MAAKGLLIVFTGDGKGKTTAALGTALRASGHGLRVLIMQFVKGPGWDYGELKALAKIDNVEVRQLGSGFIWEKESLDEDRKLAQEGFRQAKEELSSGRWDMVILDELNIVLSYGLLDEGEVLGVLRERPSGLTVIITGRAASSKLVEAADMVTEMKEVKHPYHEEVKAQRGIEF